MSLLESVVRHIVYILFVPVVVFAFMWISRQIDMKLKAWPTVKIGLYFIIVVISAFPVSWIMCNIGVSSWWGWFIGLGLSIVIIHVKRLWMKKKRKEIIMINSERRSRNDS